MGSDSEQNLKIKLNGKVVDSTNKVDNNGNVLVKEYKLYRLIKFNEFLQAQELVITVSKGTKLNAFTFGS